MTSFGRRVAALYDLYPLEYDLALAKEGYGGYTPFLLPREEGEPARDPRAEAFRSFEALRRGEIAELEALAPRAAAGVREAWEAWWAERRR
jgi:hypothetical protein